MPHNLKIVNPYYYPSILLVFLMLFISTESSHSWYTVIPRVYHPLSSDSVLTLLITFSLS